MKISFSAKIKIHNHFKQDIFSELFKRTFNCISSSAQFVVGKTYVCTAGHVAGGWIKSYTNVLL
jgi:hypothetical protein